MPSGQPPLPLLWLLSDRRNDLRLEGALRALPPRSGFVFRHYHLDPAQRAARFKKLAALARELGHLVVLAGAVPGAGWPAVDGIYGDAALIASAGTFLRLGTAHDGDELQQAVKAGADAVFLSPVFATASHPDATTLGAQGFSVLSQQSPVPVIALGGMTRERACELGWPRWGAIDGLSSTNAA